MNRDEPRASTAIHCPLGLNAIADCLEKQFSPHDLCDDNQERQVETRVQALLEAIENEPPEKIRPCDLVKLIQSLTLRKTRGIDGIPNECLKHLPRPSLAHLTKLINHCIRFSYFSEPCKKAKMIALPEQARVLNSPKIYAQLAYWKLRTNSSK
jgi:hypothetical protein